MVQGTSSQAHDAGQLHDTTCVRVWDLPVRLVHGSLVLLLPFLWWSAKEGGTWMTYHVWAGYAILALVVFRIVWGFTGSTYARFRNFVYGPREVSRYARTLFRPDAARYAGHNPLGGASALLMLLLLALQAGTGLFANDDVLTAGPLYAYIAKETSDWLSGVHQSNFYLLLTFIGLHIAAVVFYLTCKSQDLVTPMITGVKRSTPAVPAGRIQPPPHVGTGEAGG
jgi:cytochrome b